MDFRQVISAPVSRPEPAPAGTPAPQQHPKKENKNGMPRWVNWLNVVILFSIATLLALIAFSFARTGVNSEAKLVDGSKYQAVFLNNGQVYFGNITKINGDYLKLNNIFYLTQNATTGTNANTTNGDYTLVKLGCQQIHYPFDQMVINRNQVTFWENLSKDGKVAQSITEFKKQNPKGPDCSQVSNQTQSSTGTTTQGTTSPTDN